MTWDPEPDRVDRRFETPVGPVELGVPADAGGLLARKTDVFGGYEPGLVHALTLMLDPTDTLYDAGAGYGYNAAVARAAGVPQANLHLFEADDDRRAVCADNHPAATVRGTVVGDGTGATSSLDGYASDNPSPDVVTVDVEGAELDVVRGAVDLLADARPTLFVEVHPALLEHRGEDVTELYETLDRHDYRVLLGNHRTYPMEWTTDREDHPVSRQAELATYTVFARHDP